MYTLQQQLFVPGRTSQPLMVTVPRKTEKYIIGFRSKDMIPVPNVSTKISYVDNGLGQQKVHWAHKDPLMRQNVMAYHTIKTPVSRLMSLDVRECEMYIDLDNSDASPMHMYTALKYPLLENVGLILVQGAVVKPFAACTYNCWLVQPLSPSTLFHGGLLEML